MLEVVDSVTKPCDNVKALQLCQIRIQINYENLSVLLKDVGAADGNVEQLPGCSGQQVSTQVSLSSSP